MTNTMHRQGSVESLRQDYIIFATTVAGFNRKGSEKANNKFIEIMLKHRPVNMGLTRHVAEKEKQPNFIWEAIRDRFRGRRYQNGQPTEATLRSWEEALKQGSGEGPRLRNHAVFDSMDNFAAAIRDVKEADLGLCVNVNAVHEDTDRAARAAGIIRHTIEHSLGVHGRVDRLPSTEILELSTMCGHGMVSFNLVRKMLYLLSMGQISLDRAAELLAKPCSCGVFNPARAARILTQVRDGTYRP
ncbi:MAG: hypothetical protein HY695_26665 [Deltaproteobacteria bacterium]|nr:hypothetical protein [Deltaproteobacteria bacterium]